MKIDHLDIRNYLGVERVVFDPQPGFNVIIGDNGSGKTSVLTALRAVLSQWTPDPQPVFPRGQQRLLLREHDGQAYQEPQSPALVGVMGEAPDGMPFSSLDAPPLESENDLLQLERIARPRNRRYIGEAERNPNIPLPLLVSFSPWREPPRKQRPKRREAGPTRRIEGYDDALDLHADIRGFTDWLREHDQSALVESRTFDHVEKAREAVLRCLPECTDIRFIPRFNDVMLRRANGDLDPIWRLSDGFRTMIAMVGEIAWRAAILNPSQRVAVSNVGGVVLIDEIDLHLHPKWQHRVVDDLRKAFPNLQFFATTHSAFVLQGMRREEVISLTPTEQRDYYTEGIEDLSVEVMQAFEADEVVPRSALYREFERLSSRYLELVQSEGPAGPAAREVEAEFAKIQEHLVGNPALAAFLRMVRESREGEP